MATLEEGYQYGLSSNFSSFSNKSVVHVKLTDTFLKVIEDFVKKKAVPGLKPTIQFKGNHGTIRIPDVSGVLRTFQFSLSATQGDPNGSFDCVQQLDTRSGHQLQFAGSMTNKINIHATNEVFKTTKERVTQAELDSKKVSTKVIKQSGPHISRKKTTVIKNPPPSSSTSSRDRLPTNVLPVKPKQPTAPPVNFTKRPSPSYGSQGHAVSPHNPTVSSTVSNTKPLSPSLSSTTTSSSASARSGGNPAVMSMPYRDRIIHLLAIRPYKKPELIIRLRKDGIRDKDKDSLGSILSQVAISKDNSFMLAKHAYADVRLDWPFYTDDDREKLKKKLSALAPSPSSSPANRSPDSPGTIQLKRPEPQKRSIEESTHHQSSKKKRISMYEKTSNKVDCQDDRVVSSTTDKSEKKENISDMSVNSTSELPDYMKKYSHIQNADQRQRYKQEFNTEYEEYKELHFCVEKVCKKFNEFEVLLKKTPRHTPEFEELKQKICAAYAQQKEDTKYVEQKKRFDYLHGKLAFIKKLILEYDQKHAGS